MEENHHNGYELESSFNVNKISFDNVSSKFEQEFREAYKNSLEAMADSRDQLQNASGANSLAVLEKMGRQLPLYDRNADFEQSYHEMIKEYEGFTET